MAKDNIKDTLYIIMNRKGIDRMGKTDRMFEGLSRAEIPVKVLVELDGKFFEGKPTIEKHIFVQPYDKGIEIDDVHFETQTITEDEAEMIRERRIQKHIDLLRDQGYEVMKIEEKETAND